MKRIIVFFVLVVLFFVSFQNNEVVVKKTNVVNNFKLSSIISLNNEVAIVDSIEKEVNAFMKEFLTYKYNSKIAKEYFRAIYYASNKYNIKCNLILAIIKTESSFDNKAVSYCEARGPMQVMWNVWYKELKENNICQKKEELFDIFKGINAGCYVFSHYKQKTNCERLALMKYMGFNINRKGSLKNAKNYFEKVVKNKIG